MLGYAIFLSNVENVRASKTFHGIEPTQTKTTALVISKVTGCIDIKTYMFFVLTSKNIYIQGKCASARGMHEQFG